MYQHVIKVSDNYSMIMADRYKAFFAIKEDSQWVVSTVDMMGDYPKERIIHRHNEEKSAVLHIRKLSRVWVNKYRNY